MSLPARIAARYAPKFLGAMLAGVMLLFVSPAHAVVGGGVPSAEGISRSIVTIVGSRGNFCTGTLIAPKLVLTVAHCVQPGAVYKIVEYGANRQPQLKDVRSIAIHPAFNMQAMMAHRATADIALLQLETPPPEKTPAVLGEDSDPRRQPLHYRRRRCRRPRRRQERRPRSHRGPGRHRSPGHSANSTR
jgi:hypothetical protein